MLLISFFLTTPFTRHPLNPRHPVEKQYPSTLSFPQPPSVVLLIVATLLRHRKMKKVGKVPLPSLNLTTVFLLLLLTSSVHSFYLPGVAPRDFQTVRYEFDHFPLMFVFFLVFLQLAVAFPIEMLFTICAVASSCGFW